MLDPASAQAGLIGFKALLDKIGEAVGGANRPRQVRRLAEAHAHAVRELAAADADARLIAVDTDIEIEEKREAQRQRALLRAEAEAVREQQNLEQIAEKARHFLAEGSQPAEIDNDWVANALGYARNVSDEQMQELWARVLAGEANRKGSFSRQTINRLNDLDKNDCELFRTLCRFAVWIGARCYPLVFTIQGPDAAGYAEHGITFDSLRHLESLGLIQMEPTGGFTCSGFRSGYALVRHHDEHFFLTMRTDNPGTEFIPVGQVLVTKVGAELASICDLSPIDGERVDRPDGRSTGDRRRTVGDDVAARGPAVVRSRCSQALSHC